MPGITIADSVGDFLSINLIDILRLLKSFITDTKWQLSEVECIGTTADEIHQLSDINAKISSQKLIELAAGITQVIDGYFEGYRYTDAKPWLVIQAVDSSAYDVECEDGAVLTLLKQSFKEIADLPLSVSV